MKYLILAAIVALLFALLLRRLLPYLRMAQKFIQALQQLRSGTSGSQVTPARSRQQQERLVRCDVCGTWVPATRALGGGATARLYCSDSCRRKQGAGFQVPGAR